MTATRKRPLTWRGWIVPAGAVVLVVTAVIVSKLIAPGLKLVTPRFEGPSDGAVWIDRQGGPRPIAVGAPFVSGALLGIGPEGARFRVDPEGRIEVSADSQLRFLNGPDSTTFELLRGEATITTGPETPRTILATQSGSFAPEQARVSVWSGNPADAAYQERLRSLAPELAWTEIFGAAERELFLLRLESGRLTWQPTRGVALAGGERELAEPCLLVVSPGLPLQVGTLQ